MKQLIRKLWLVSCLGLAACGGAGTDGTGPSGNTVNVGVATGITEPTVTVNGVAYERGAATVADGFGQVVGADELRLGMWLKVSGTVDESSGAVEASRIERLSAAVRKPVELRGRVSQLDTAARTLTVGRQSVRYDGAALTLRQALADGQIARVSSLAPPVNGQPWVVGPLFTLEGVPVDASGANNRAVVTGNGKHVAVIGALVSGTLNAKTVARSLPGQPVVFVSSAQVTQFMSIADFRLRGVTIDASSASFVGGVASELADGRRMKATGSVSGRKLIATKVEFLP